MLTMDDDEEKQFLDGLARRIGKPGAKGTPSIKLRQQHVSQAAMADMGT